MDLLLDVFVQRSPQKNMSLHYPCLLGTADIGARACTLQMGEGKMLDIESHTEPGFIFMNAVN